MALLAVTDLTKDFGGLRAVSRFTFDVEPAEILGLIGPNGAGKTTVFNLITGFLRPSSGGILLEGTRIVGLRPHAVTRRGVAREDSTRRSTSHGGSARTACPCTRRCGEFAPRRRRQDFPPHSGIAT